MRRFLIIIILIVGLQPGVKAQATTLLNDTSKHILLDTVITLREVDDVVFRNSKDAAEYGRDINNIRIVLPYLKIAKHLYAEVQQQKQNDSKKQYRHYRKDLEKEMRDKFEKEVKDLTISQGKILFKLIGRETGQNSYHIIKDVKNGFTAFTYQVVAKHFTYDLKEDYNPHKEWILEMAIAFLGPEYNPN